MDHSRMVRVDVFSKPNRRGQDAFYLVPVYVHQVMNPSLGAAGVPNRAISASSNNLSEAHFDPAALRMGMPPPWTARQGSPRTLANRARNRPGSVVGCR